MALPHAARDGSPGATTAHGQHVGVTTAAISATSLVLAGVLAPPAPRAPGLVLGLPLLAAASMHVAATPWLATLRATRECAAGRRVRFVAMPAALLVACVVGACALSMTALEWCLLGFFSWQFVHFAKQNVGVACLSASAAGLPSLTGRERRWILASGLAGVAGLLARPSLVEVPISPSPALFWVATAGFCACAAGGLLELRRRAPTARSWGTSSSYVVAVCFSAPIFCGSSPYAAVAGMAIAHGLQYLGLVGLVAVGPLAATRRPGRVTLLVAIAVLGGLALHAVSRLHDPHLAGRVGLGLYLGAYAAHFVVDGGLWRLSVPSSRRFAAAALPTLVPGATRLGRRATAPTTGGAVAAPAGAGVA